MKHEILVIDDNPDIRYLICGILKEKDFNVRSAANFNQAINEIDKKLPDLAIIDIKLDKDDKDGIDLLKHIVKKNKSTPVIMISGHANVKLAVEAIRLGAYEFIEKPFSTEKILNYVNRALESLVLKEEIKTQESKLFHSFDFIGKSQEIEKIKKIIEKLSNVESRVLITGQTGTGKELLARKIHKNSEKSKYPFIVLNASVLKGKNYEKELFGEDYANENFSQGMLEKANKRTLLIDEVSEIPLAVQANILRVLIDQRFRRVNGKKDINVNIRIISSSSKNLETLVSDGLFREDLYHRLNVVPVKLPPLSSRTEDIPLLVAYFKKKLSEINGTPESKIDPHNERLLTYSWPGNIRELRNVIERLSILAESESADSVDSILKDILNENQKNKINDNFLKSAMTFPLKEAREVFEKNYLENQLKKNHGNIAKTADYIGMERSALHRKLKALGIKGIN
jgi:two-component system nitrogen regulation response regulator NtrX